MISISKVNFPRYNRTVIILDLSRIILIGFNMNIKVNLIYYQMNAGGNAEKMSDGRKDDTAPITMLRLLQLRNCGHGFTDQVAITVSEKHAPGLEILELTGCYRLNETALCSL